MTGEEGRKYKRIERFNAVLRRLVLHVKVIPFLKAGGSCESCGNRSEANPGKRVKRVEKYKRIEMVNAVLQRLVLHVKASLLSKQEAPASPAGTEAKPTEAAG